MRRILTIMMFAALAAAAACSSNLESKPGYVDHNNDIHYWEE